MDFNEERGEIMRGGRVERKERKRANEKMSCMSVKD